MPSLRPSGCEGVEAGLDWRPAARARIGLTAFANRLEGAIANVTLGRGPGTFPGVGFVAAGGDYRQRDNLDSIEAKGVELDGALRARRLDALGRLVLGRRGSGGERAGAGAGRPEAGPDSAAQPVLDPGLGGRRRPRLGHGALRRRPI